MQFSSTIVLKNLNTRMLITFSLLYNILDGKKGAKEKQNREGRRGVRKTALIDLLVYFN